MVPPLLKVIFGEAELLEHLVIGAFVDLVPQVTNRRHGRSVVEQSMAAFTTVGHSPDTYAALFAEGMDAPHKFVASHSFQ
jgi:hypothetical protein